MRSGDSRKALIRRGFSSSSAGFAAVDALVALTILASTLILALGAAGSAQRAAAAGLEARRVQLLLGFLMILPKDRLGIWSGADRGLDWTLELSRAADGSIQGVWPLCRRVAKASNPRTGRHYDLSTIETCSLGVPR